MLWRMKDITEDKNILMGLIEWIKRKIKEHKQKKLDTWKIKQLSEDCQQCELLGICRDREKDWKCRRGCLLWWFERKKI